MAQMKPTRRWPSALAACVLMATASAPVAAQAPVAYQSALDAGWAGQYPLALQRIDAYLRTHPDDRGARLDRARFLAWSGDYAAALSALDALPADDADVVALRARTLAWAGRRDAARMLNAPLYAAAPNDYDTAWTQALVMRQGEWPQQALPALATVQAQRPDARDTLALAKAVRLPLFSSVAMPLSDYSDSDDIEIRSAGIEASLRLSDGWRLLAGVTQRRHSAPADGPFAPRTGGEHVDETRAGAGVHIAASRDVGIDAWLGQSRLHARDAASDTATIGRVALSQHASDTFSYTVGASRDRVDASPRALSVLRNGLALDARWTPTLRDTLAMRVGAEHFDDGNQRQSALADYRHAVLRTGMIMFDAGGQLEWQHNARQTDNGYYSPDRYTRLAPQVAAYWAFNPESGLYVSAALGVQRDETFSSWKRAADLYAEYTLGIFSHWQLVTHAAYSQRLNQLGHYEGTTVGLALRYRFCEFASDRCPLAH